MKIIPHNFHGEPFELQANKLESIQDVKSIIAY